MNETSSHWFESLFERGNALANLQRYADAIPCYLDVLDFAPTHVRAQNNLGVMFAELKRFPEAIMHYQQAISIQPDYADAHYNLANAFKENHKTTNALDHYRLAIQYQPNFASAYNNQAICLMQTGELHRAIESFEAALRLSPHMATAHNGLGLALAHIGRPNDAMICYDRALQLDSDLAEAHYNRGLCSLLLGDLLAGWRDYEWRWRLPEIIPRQFAEPMWDGGPLEGKTILVHAEQGLGDTIQFVRFARLLEQRGARVLLQCSNKLHGLLRNCRGVHELLPERPVSFPPFDVHCPIMSLAKYFVGNLQSIPKEVPYLLAKESRIERWKRELSSHSGMKIGLCWQGSKGYRWDHLRSIALQEMKPISQIANVQLISLQKGLGSEQVAANNFLVHDFTDGMDNEQDALLDTAAMISCLDLVISVDSAIGHLAGTLGAPTWLALSKGPDWRWHLGGDRSPWYPKTRLFRQTDFGDWPSVFQRMATELREVLLKSNKAAFENNMNQE